MNDPQRDRPSQSGAKADAVAAEQSLGLEDVSFDEDERATNVGAPKAVAPSGPIAVHVVGRSDVGLVREHNEDNYLLADLASGSRDPSTFHEVPREGLVLAVCDGMGGAAAGEVASQLAVDTILEMMRRSVPTSDRDGFARALVRSVEEAGARIFEAARADRTRRGMGTTSTVAALMDRTLFVGQVGDSRAYVLRNGELKQVTKDQSLVNQLIEAGQLTEDEAEAFEHSNIILQALGTTDQVSVDLTFLELRRGDRLLLCSDGLSGLVHGDVIREVMTEYRDLSACCERLIELAKAGGGHDNVTVLLCDFSGEGLALPAPTDLAGYQQYPLPPSDDARSGSGANSEVPTLAPPGGMERDGDDFDDFGDIRGVSTKSSSSGARYVVIAIVLIAIAGAVYLLRGKGEHGSLNPDEQTKAVVPVAVEPAPPSRVEVVVRTDVESGELLVNGESFGMATEGRWVLDLPPGPHKLEARAGGTVVTSSMVSVREGVPATVLLSRPEDGTTTPDAGAAAATAKPAAEGAQAAAEPVELSAEEKARAERRERRRRLREAAESEGSAEAAPSATP